MTLRESLVAAYAWGVDHGTAVLVAALLGPVLGGVAAKIGKGGRTDEDGRFIASAVLAVGVLAVIGELMAVHAGHAYFDAGLLDADVRLVVAPLLCLVGCVVAIRLVFPLSELGGVKTASDLGLLFLACAGTIWFFSKFRGWGIVFFGSFLQLVVVLVIAGYFLRRLYRRAFRLDR
jgi:hypothetical protein